MVQIEVLDIGVRVRDLDIPRKGISEYLREFDGPARELAFIQALEVGVFCLERASAARDIDFVRQQAEGLLNGLERAVSGIPESVKTELLNQVGTRDGQVLGPVQHLVEDVSRVLTERLNGVKQLLTDEIDPDKRSSTLGQALGAIKDLVDPNRSDSIQGALDHAVRDVTGRDGALAAAVKETVGEAVRPLADELNRLGRQMAATETAQEALQDTTKKGGAYEEHVLTELQAWSAATGAAITHVGPDNQAGDVLIEFPEACVVGSAPTIVVEARDRSSAFGRKAVADTLSRAMAERDANAAIYLSRSRDGLAKEIGEWAEGATDRGPWLATTHEHLFVGIRFLLVQHRLAVLHDAMPDIDRSAVEAQVERIRIALKRVTNINRSVGEIRSHAGSVQDEAELLRHDIRDALGALEESIRTAARELAA